MGTLIFVKIYDSLLNILCNWSREWSFTLQLENIVTIQKLENLTF